MEMLADIYAIMADPHLFLLVVGGLALVIILATDIIDTVRWVPPQKEKTSYGKDPEQQAQNKLNQLIINESDLTFSQMTWGQDRLAQYQPTQSKNERPSQDQ